MTCRTLGEDGAFELTDFNSGMNIGRKTMEKGLSEQCCPLDFSAKIRACVTVFVHLAAQLSDSLRPHGLQSASFLCPWDSPGKNTAVGQPFPSLGDLSDPGTEPSLLHCRRVLYHLSHQGSPRWKCSILLTYLLPNVVTTLSTWNVASAADGVTFKFFI